MGFFSYVWGLGIFYVWELVFLRFEFRESYVWGLVFLRFVVSNSYLWGLRILTFEGSGLLRLKG